MYDVLENEGTTLFSGLKSTRVRVPGPDLAPTFYTCHGDPFGQGCALLAVAFRAAGIRGARGTIPA